MAAYSFLDLAFDVLKAAASPLTYQEIWQIGKADLGTGHANML